MTEAAGHMPMPESSDTSPKTPSASTSTDPVTRSLHVEIKLDDLLWDPERGTDLTGRIAQEAAEQLLSGMHAEIVGQMRMHTETILREKLTDIIETMLSEAIEKAIQGTDSYGNPKGEPTTLHEVIVKRADVVLRERRSNGPYNGKPLIEQIVAEEIGRAFTKELAETVAAARADVLAAVKDQAAQILTETIARSVPR